MTFPEKSNKPTIVCVCSCYPRHNTDNAGIFLRFLNQNLSLKGYNIIVLAPHHDKIINNIKDRNISIVYFRYFFRKFECLAYGAGVLPNIKRHPLNVLLIPFFLISQILSLFRICIQKKPDIIHAHWIIPQGLVAVIIGKFFKIPVLATTHGVDAFSLQSRLLKWFKAFTLKNCAAWTANTETTAVNLDAKKEFLNKLTIIPMGINTSVFTKNNKNVPHSTQRENFLILFVGRLIELKGVLLLIDAFKMLSEDDKNKSELWIIGEGDLRAEIEHQLHTHNLKERIKLLGEIENNSLPEYYKKADVLVVPSLIEGQGVVILEAMASGTPVIASAVGGVVDVIKDGVNGILVQPGNSGELAKKLSFVIENKKDTEKLALNAFKTVNTRYEWRIIANYFSGIYDSIHTTNNPFKKKESIEIDN